MTKKDFTTSENIDREKEPQTESLDHSISEKGSAGKTRVKNANAAGDGSFGRNETSLPEEDEMGEKREEDPPY